jgi:hypothetical protein
MTENQRPMPGFFQDNVRYMARALQHDLILVEEVRDT